MIAATVPKLPYVFVLEAFVMRLLESNVLARGIRAVAAVVIASGCDQHRTAQAQVDTACKPHAIENC
jgi:hypothetical protein